MRVTQHCWRVKEKSSARQDYNRKADEEDEMTGEGGRVVADVSKLSIKLRIWNGKLNFAVVSPHVRGCGYQNFKLFSNDSVSLSHTVRWAG